MSSDATVRRNIFVLALAQTLGGSNGPIVISLGGLVGQELTTDAALVTLPVSLYNLGLALGTLPAAFIMRRFGRRSGYLLGACCGTAAGLIAFAGIYWASFWIFPVLLLLRAPDHAEAREEQLSGGRPMGEILRTPRYMLAVAAGVVSYGLMTFVMTAAPIAMVHTGHSVDHAALGIQWHVLAMFAPSFVTGRLMARYGKEKITAIGLAIIGVSAMVALSGLDIGHFWVSLTLLGIGWNFGFLGATAMVTDCHTPEERSKVQGTNDFIVFGIVAIASFTSGALLNSSGWTMLNWLVLPAVALILVPLIWRIRQAPGATAA